MHKSLLGTKAAFLVCGGFYQKQFMPCYRALTDLEVSIRVVSPDIGGIVNGWTGEGWGHNYAVDVPLSRALGVDYDFLVVPGGSRSVNKLKLTAHSKRFIGSFLDSGKPVAVIGDALYLPVWNGQLDGYGVAMPHQQDNQVAQTEKAGRKDVDTTQNGLFEAIGKSGAVIQGGPVVCDRNLITGAYDPDDAQQMRIFVKKMLERVMMAGQMDRAA